MALNVSDLFFSLSGPEVVSFLCVVCVASLGVLLGTCKEDRKLVMTHMLPAVR